MHKKLLIVLSLFFSNCFTMEMEEIVEIFSLIKCIEIEENKTIRFDGFIDAGGYIFWDVSLNLNKHEIGRGAIVKDLKLNRGIITRLFIDPKYRSQGYGSIFFQTMCKFLKDKNCSPITWKVEPFDDPENEGLIEKLIKFYKKNGGIVIDNPIENFESELFGFHCGTVMEFRS